MEGFKTVSASLWLSYRSRSAAIISIGATSVFSTFTEVWFVHSISLFSATFLGQFLEMMLSSSGSSSGCNDYNNNKATASKDTPLDAIVSSISFSSSSLSFLLPILVLLLLCRIVYCCWCNSIISGCRGWCRGWCSCWLDCG